VDNIIPVAIDEEVRSSYLDYAMSVIVSRALPDVRDGLKPVQRRILYAMWRLGTKYNTKFVKSARICGEVTGKFHPHGDVAVYDALARMAQTFSLRYTLIDGQGNWGSIDGDPPAAARYTEARLAKISQELLDDLDKDTVDWKDTYDVTRKEPQFLPARVPHLLLNGVQGIAVGMATNIPPHHLGELCDALLYMLDNANATLDELLQFVKGPDFPTAGIIYDANAIREVYASGRGAIPMRARLEVTEDKKGKFIVISQLPYQVNKSDLITHIADLVREGKVEGIADIIDGSREGGVNIVIELKKSAQAQKVLNQLFLHTQLQKNINVLMIALVDGIEPRLLSLGEMLGFYLDHRRKTVTRRIEFLLRQANARLHILEGLAIALDNIDAIIASIKASANREAAKLALQNTFALSDLQAEAILQMRLQELARLERDSVLKEKIEKEALVKEYENILANPKKIAAIIREELVETKETYKDKRKTEVVSRALGKFNALDLVQKEATLITLTKNGYVKRTSPKTYQTQGRGGVGIIGVGLAEGDAVLKILQASTYDDILFFSSDGRMFITKAYEISEKGRTAKGDGVYEFFQNAAGIVDMSILREGLSAKDYFLVAMSRSGLIKKVSLDEVFKAKRKGIKIMNVKDGDEALGGFIVKKEQEMLAVTKNGSGLRFNLSEVRPMGRTAQGVRGIRLKPGDALAGLVRIDDNQGQALIISEKGFGKRVKVSAFTGRHRGGSGMKASKVTPKTGRIKNLLFLDPELKELFLYSQEGKTLRVPLSSISLLGRATQGVRIMRLKGKDEVASAVLI